MKVIQEHQKCIGCGSCAAICPKYWEMTDDGKAKPVEGKINPDNNYQLEIEETGCNQNAADVCPVQCIKIEK